MQAIGPADQSLCRAGARRTNRMQAIGLRSSRSAGRMPAYRSQHCLLAQLAAPGVERVAVLTVSPFITMDWF